MMKTNDKSMIEEYGITCEQKSIYKYKTYRYDKLEDAINFAKLDHQRSTENLLLLTNDNAQSKQSSGE